MTGSLYLLLPEIPWRCPSRSGDGHYFLLGSDYAEAVGRQCCNAGECAGPVIDNVGA